jgi:LmbE family N-acetylglucosaminyl deacetylase
MTRLMPWILLAALAAAQERPRVLYVTAHPDDEDAATLTYLARGLGASVTLLSITRGEAGANVITGDFFEALGALRALELEQAALHYGVRVRFTSFQDFGYSKNVAETWRNWDRKALAGEVQRMVQEVKPHVLMSRFHGSARDGHGHHTAAGEITKQVFAEAEDQPWKPLKLYTGNWSENDAWTFQTPAGDRHPVLGRTYAELGLDGYRWHRSQGMDRMLQRAPSAFLERGRFYKLEGTRVGPAIAKEKSVLERLSLLPDLSIQFTSESGVLPLGAEEYRTTVILRRLNSKPVKGEVLLTLPGRLSAAPAAFDLSVQDQVELPFVIQTAAESGQAREIIFKAVAKLDDGRILQTQIRPVTAPGLPAAYLKVRPGLKVAYLMGSGDEVPETIRQLNVPVDLIADLGAADLSGYTALMLGIRAYAAREDVKRHNQKILDFAARGGVVIVQYNTQEYDGNFGPYPYSMTTRAEEVSEEDAPVTILEPGRPVFAEPNRITPGDFMGWVEQRGSKFWMTWDARYTPLIETHDTGQDPQKGVWLEARHGKGLYVYCALAWYRQLPAGVPGAVRLFANLLSLRP